MLLLNINTPINVWLLVDVANINFMFKYNFIKFNNKIKNNQII